MRYCYNIIDEGYFKALKNPVRREKIMLEILDWDEHVTGVIINDISSEDKGTITQNNSAGCQRACNISVIGSSDMFGINKKFRLWQGIVIDDVCYLFSQGIYLAKDMQYADYKYNITACDKYGVLNGELKTGAFDTAFSVNAGRDVYIGPLVRALISRDMGNGHILDSKPALVDMYYEKSILVSDIIVGAGGHISETLENLASWYGANIYYDSNGQLQMSRIFDYGFPAKILQKSSKYTFTKDEISDYTESTSYDGCNTVRVSTDNSDGEVCTVVVKNRNARSPYCVQKAGIRLYDGDGVTDGTYYIPLRSGNKADNIQACKDMGAYILQQEMWQKITKSFNAPVVPHLSVGDVITVDNSDCIIQSLTIPLQAGELMTVEAISISQIPYDEEGLA